MPSSEMLREMKLLLLEEGHCFRDQALSFCNKQSSLPREVLDASSLSTLVQMVRAGMGVTLIPEMAMAVETRSASVSVARFRDPQPSRTIGMIWRKTSPLAGKLLQISEVVCHSADALREQHNAGSSSHNPGHDRLKSKDSRDSVAGPFLFPSCILRSLPMPPPTIRPARPDEYDEIARVWMNSWVSTGLEEVSNFLLAKLRARIPMEIEKGWSLHVADDGGTLAAMLALHLPDRYLDQLFVAPEYQGRSVGRMLLAFTRAQLPDEIWLRCVRENEKAWRWYEREGFVFEKEQIESMTGFVMKYYRWTKEGNAQ